MTYRLKNYFEKIKKESAKIEIVPMTVEVDRFLAEYSSPVQFEYIAYAGGINSAKDGVDVLIRSFLKIADKNDNIHLLLIGDNSKIDNHILSLIDTCSPDIRKRIHFTGLIDRTEIPKYLKNAKVLALARPDSLQAQGGFPSKLGEYLATGKPVVVTRTGEIPLYLEDGKNAFLCEPGNVNDFSSKLDHVLTAYSNSLRIGEEGQKVALSVFNSKVQSKKLSDFLEAV